MLNISKFDWGWMNDGSDVGNFHKNAIHQEIFIDSIYERIFQVEEGDVVVDIGSSVGPFAYSILDKKPKHVFCLEPSEKEFPTLVRNTTGYPVTQIFKGICDRNSNVSSSTLFGGEEFMDGITFKKFCHLYNLEKIDFLKTDCEGGEYDIFTIENLDFIKNNIKKISGEWHLASQSDKNRFRYFRDNILINFNNYTIFSLDGFHITWDLWNEHFIEYYTEVIICISN